MEFSLDTSLSRASQLDSQQIADWCAHRLSSLYQAHTTPQLEEEEVVDKLYALLEKVAYLATVEEGLEFPTLFTRLAYLKSMYQLPGKILFGAQSFRKQVEQKRVDWKADQLVSIGFWVNDHLISSIWKVELQFPELDDVVRPLLQRDRKILRFEGIVRGVAIKVNTKEEVILFLREDDSAEEIRVAYNEADRNELFTKNIEDMESQGVLPIAMNLWQVEIDQKGVYHPKALIIEPDFLIDVTAIAACFSQKPVDLLPYILRKFIPTDAAPPLLKGNIANYILDQLLQDDECTFTSVFQRTFHLYPLDFASLDEHTMRQVYEDAKAFFMVIQRVVKEQLEKLRISPGNCAIEPSFYQPDLGLQGRLDVLHLNKEEEVHHIIELKSGKTFMPNKYGLNTSHYVQTLLYDLLVNYALPDAHVLSYILYCKEYQRPLRNAPIASEQQLEAIQVRNRIILWERFLGKLKGTTRDLDFFKKINTKYFKTYGYLKRDTEQYQKVFKNLTSLEQKYYAAFVGFLSREYHLAKVGSHHSERNYGLASIWRESSKQKSDRFALLNDLQLKENQVAEDHTIWLQRTQATDPLANFRAGDIAVLYPQSQQTQPARGEIFKCSIVDITEEGILIRLRNIQLNNEKFKKGSKWNLEHDVFDSSFNKSFQNLFLWASASPQKRAIFMGLRAPGKGAVDARQWDDQLTQEQKRILTKMEAAKDYFLLWGPPGTGKTSIMLRHYVQDKIEEGKERILLLAYTNRAVDEICAALEEIKEETSFEYLRIGSRYGTDPEYRPYLLREKVLDVDSRSQLKEMLDQHPVYVGTVASFSGKRNLLDLITFNEVIIDEASQLLEPMMGNLIHDFPKIIMIGDHLQLPAVVQQSPISTKVEDEELLKVGLHDLRNSLFERLFHRAMTHEWDWAYDTLSLQGRMHVDIVRFPSENFYGDDLRTLDHLPEFRQRLFGEPELKSIPSNLAGTFVKNRLTYIPSSIADREQLAKTNIDEASKAVKLVKMYKSLWDANEWEWNDQTLGIITPFRAQIAQIRKELWALNEEWTQQISVDTVERYQGGARDIVIMSLCVNHPTQWEAVVSQNSQGLDRKLNVAITRARKYFSLIANPEILSTQALYAKLKENCVEVKL